jgi:redox-sensitive bicupin YhaK (pirin superfamily)
MVMDKTSNSGEVMTAAIDIHRASERFYARIGWLDSYHSFSFGHHYDPKNTGHGLLLVSNDDTVKGGTGFRPTPTVTWKS